MDIKTLANDLVAMIAPVLASMGQREAGQTPDEVAPDAAMLWAELEPWLEERPDAWVAVQAVAAHPDDQTAWDTLRQQLEQVLVDNPALADKLAGWLALSEIFHPPEQASAVESKGLEAEEDTTGQRGQRAKPPAMEPPVTAPSVTPPMAGESAPPPGAPLSQNLIEEPIRLDVASPETVEVDRTFEVAVRVSQPDTPPLSEETLTKVTSRPGRVYRKPDEQAVRYRISVTAADCKVHTPEQEFLLYPGRDSDVIYFQLTPLRAGQIAVIVSAYQPDNLLAASARIRVSVSTQAAPAADARPQFTSTLTDVNKAPVDLTPAPDDLKLKLYTALSGDAFSLEDLEDLSFRLDVDWDSLSGDNKVKKARMLVLHLARLDQLPRLREAVLAARPTLSNL